MRVSDVISNVTKQNKTWTSWRQGTKLRVRLSLANARFASRIESDVYNKKKIQMFVVNMTFISSREVKKCIFHPCLRHSWNVHFFTSLDEIKVIFTPNIWISSIYETIDEQRRTVQRSVVTLSVATFYDCRNTTRFIKTFLDNKMPIFFY